MATRHPIGGWLRNSVSWHEIPSPSYIVGVGIIGGIGLSTLCVHVLHLLVRAENLPATLLGAVLPALLSSILLAMAMWIHLRGFDEVVVRAGVWCLVGTVVLIGVSVTSFTYQFAKGVAMVDPIFVVSNHVTVGAIMGTLMGLYDGQRHKRGRNLRIERERATELSKRLTILNRVLRHDIRNTVNIIQGNATLVRNGTTDSTTAVETIETKAAELQELSDRARQLEQYFEQEHIPVTTVDIAPVLRTKAFKLRDRYPSAVVDSELPDAVEVQTVGLFDAAIDELLENAVHHNDADEPQVVLSVSREGDGTVVIQVQDDGPHISDNEIDVLEQGFETDLKHMSGLGLWLVHLVVAESGGEISFDRLPERGNRIELRLPRGRGPSGSRADREY